MYFLSMLKCGFYLILNCPYGRVVPQPNVQNQYSNSSLISIAPRRPPRSQYVHFNKATAALFLRQTESFWLQPDLTRQAGKGGSLDGVSIDCNASLSLPYSYRAITGQTSWGEVFTRMGSGGTVYFSMATVKAQHIVLQNLWNCLCYTMEK